jgi:DNA-binding response OmpR family regulator
MTVLIVERDLGFAFWLGRALDRIGFGSFPAKDVSSAESLTRELNLAIDLLIIDPELPGATALIQKIKKLESTAKVIFVGNHENPPMGLAADGLPADGYLCKPGPSSKLDLADLDSCQTIFRDDLKVIAANF